MEDKIFRGKVRRIHFVGIGGIGMSGIAEVLLQMGFEVHGSDLKESDTVKRLRDQGAAIAIGHAEENVDEADVVVMSSAVNRENPEIRAARAKKIPIIPRAEMLAELMRMKHGIAIAGSHGKTTTTSIVTAILNHAGLDPTVVIGGKVNQLGSNAKLGAGDHLIAEADESDGSFLKLSPTIAVVTNLDLEHVDHWRGGLEELQAAFVSFLERLPFYGLGVVCIDAENVQAILPKVGRRLITYGTSAQADYQIADIRPDGMRTHFELRRNGTSLGSVTLNLIGEHNCLNAVAAIAIADELGIPFSDSKSALESFQGVQRRFTLRGESAGVQVVDDYGHHPVEIKATLRAAREAFAGRRIVCLFQPHRYSRTEALLGEFGRAFNDADRVWVTDVYAAGEAPIATASPTALIRSMRSQGHHAAEVAGTLDEAIAIVAEALQPNDVLLTLGAGDITKAGPMILELLKQREANA